MYILNTFGSSYCLQEQYIIYQSVCIINVWCYTEIFPLFGTVKVIDLKNYGNYSCIYAIDYIV